MYPSKIALAALLAATFAGSQAQGTAPTDPQIAAIVVTANQVDIDAGNFAKARTASTEVKAFAQQMVTDHGAVNQSATELVTRLKVKPEASDTSRSLQKGGDENLAHLKALKGVEFDRAYVDHKVAYHQAVLDSIDKTLLPNAKNAELKALLEQSRPAFVAHLEHARHLLADLGK